MSLPSPYLCILYASVQCCKYSILLILTSDITFQGRAQISFFILHVHHPEEESGGADREGVLQFTEGAMQICRCKYSWNSVS